MMKSNSKIKDPLLTCLQLLAKHHLIPCTHASLTAGLPLVNHKLTPALFARSAERVHLNTFQASCDLTELNHTVVLPALLLLKENNACILNAIDGQYFTITWAHEPNKTKRISRESLNDLFSGQVIWVHPTDTIHSPHDESRNTSALQGWFWDVLKKAVPVYREVLIASFLINIFAIAMPLFAMNVYDRVVPNHAIDTLWVLSIGVIIVLGFDHLLKNLRNYYVDTMAKQLDTKLFASLYEQVMGIKMQNRPKNTGHLVNSLHSFESLREFLSSATLTVVTDVPFVLLFLVITQMIGGWVVCVPLLAIPIMVIACYFMQLPLQAISRESHGYNAGKQSTLLETLHGIETIKSLGAEGFMQRKAEYLVCKSAALKTKSQALTNELVNFANFIQLLANVFVVIVGVYLIADNQLTMGALIACTILTGRALVPMTKITSLITRYHQAKTAYQELSQIMLLPTERPKTKSFIQKETIKGDIEFQQAGFHYSDQKIPCLDNINIKIKAGEKVGIIGRNGSGKSSLLKLIVGLYQTSSGNTLIDGISVSQWDPAVLRKQIGYLPQDITLFQGSIRQNIMLGNPHASDEEIIHACELSGVLSFIDKHPDGFDRQVGERGLALSVGQRQAIALARTLLTQPKIILLDEPTSNLDDFSENLFKSRLEQVMGDKTLLLITHKGSVLSLVDRLLVVEGGKVIIDGDKRSVIEMLSSNSREAMNSKKGVGQ